VTIIATGGEACGHPRHRPMAGMERTALRPKLAELRPCSMRPWPAERDYGSVAWPSPSRLWTAVPLSRALFGSLVRC